MSRVIRGGGAIVPGVVVDARGDAARILDEARARAERIIAEAREHAERARSEAADRGKAAAETETAAHLVAAARLRDRALADAEQELGRLSLAVARRLVGEELAVAPERIAAIVRDVLTRARRAQSVTIRVSPEDVPALRAALGDAGPAVEEDASIERGGCVVRTELGEIDARLSVKIESLARALGIDGSGRLGPR